MASVTFSSSFSSSLGDPKYHYHLGVDQNGWQQIARQLSWVKLSGGAGRWRHLNLFPETWKAGNGVGRSLCVFETLSLMLFFKEEYGRF